MNGKGAHVAPLLFILKNNSASKISQQKSIGIKYYFMDKKILKLKEELLLGLENWAEGKIDENTMLCIAENLLEKYGWKDFGKNKPESVVMEALSQLEILNHQLICKDDIPAIKRFLENNKNPESSWADWESYWNSVDFNEREGRLNAIEFYRSL
ncbi:hypothetical protein [Sessilibacter corallicola]|uniref:hypothetical protein n=1 Tax=Sessilibacter corallicola TaxID=2904075 RepID=UPI001E616306|nr:hypothetical protein [Sessilibacter corallicola]MCE2030335.1 hypothetical protein [Sessilibacter corallicola]